METNERSEDRKTNCTHETAEHLGSNNSTSFLRCLACNSVIVAQGDLRLAIPPRGEEN